MRGPKPYGDMPFFIVVRGPVPRERWSAPTMARDRPSPYGEGGGLSAALLHRDQEVSPTGETDHHIENPT